MRRRPIEEEIEQWFCHAPAADVQTMLVGLRLICRARGGVNWPEAEGKRKRRKSAKPEYDPQVPFELRGVPPAPPRSRQPQG